MSDYVFLRSCKVVTTNNRTVILTAVIWPDRSSSNTISLNSSTIEKSNANEGVEEETSISRRSWLKSLGIASVFILETGAATATSDGYGEGGYGEGGYGDPTDSLTVTTDGVSDVGETSATLDGSLTDLGGDSFADVFFEYRKTSVTTWSTTATQTLFSTGSFGASISGLDDGVDYEFRAVASASDGDSDTGSITGFTTLEHSISVSTDGATDVAGTSVTLNGSVTNLGNESSVDVYFEYREIGSSGWNTTSTQPLTSTRSFSETPTSLSTGTDYEFRAVALASDGDTATGSSDTFSTSSAENDPVIE